MTIRKDPWRFRSADAPPVSEVDESPKIKQVHKETTSDYVPNKGDNEDEEQFFSKTVTYPNYGGITVTGTDRPEAIASAVLQFCVSHRAEIDDTLTHYGLLVAKLQPQKLELPFYITRADGWTLTIPDAETRQQGLLALIQCLLTLDEIPKHRKAMRALGLQPFRL